MEDEKNNRRLLLAAGLCFLVLMVWQFLFPAKRPVRPVAPPQAVGTSTSVPAAAPTSSGLRSGTSTLAARPTREVKPVHFVLEGKVRPPDEPEDQAIPYSIELTNVGGGIDRFELASFKERDRDNRKTDKNIHLATSVENDPDLFGQMAGVDFVEGTTFKMPPVPVYEVVESKPDSVRYRFVTQEGVEIEREYHLNRESFQLELAVTVRNGSKTDQSERLQLAAALASNDAMEAGGGFFSSFVPPPDHLNAVCHTQNSVERFPFQKLVKMGVPKVFSETVRWAAIDRQYFLAAIVSRDGTQAECRLSGRDKLARAALVLPQQTLKPGEDRRHKFTAYLGVKKPKLLTKLEADGSPSGLEGAIDYTILGMDLRFLCEALLWVLKLFHRWFGSWGLAILGLTVLVKTLLFPLNQRSGRSMRAMSALKPQIEAIRARFPDDRQRQSEEMLRLYKEHNVNPAGGCLPILIQMPIWFALYRSLWVSVDLFQQSFLWIPDLTARDPMWVLPVLLVVVMFLQQRMTPSTMDPAQQKIMQYTMPLLFGAMMMALPAGLCFYILVNTLLTILQQHFINRSIGPIGGSASVQGAPA
jgi:YidC/Oxa1 family membrane protein insertase